jgi:hypothetical protein
MRKLKFEWRSLLAVPFLLMSTAVFAGTILSVGPTYPVGVAVGDTAVPVSLQITNNSTSPQDVGDVRVTLIRHTPSCGNDDVPCTAPDLGVFAASASGTGVGDCAGITFTIAESNATTGELTFTPSAFVDLAKGETCTIGFTVNVLKVPTIDWAGGGAGIQTVQSARASATHISSQLPGGASGTSATTVAQCGVEVDKQVSCDGGTTWVDQGFEVNNGDGTNACNGLSTAQIKVRYQARNTGTGCALTGCTWTESNNAFGQPTAPFDMADGASKPLTTPASALCSTAYGDPQNPNEPDKIDISCNAEFGDPVKASDSAGFACLTVAAKVDRNVSCNGDPSTDMTLVVSNEDNTNGCTTLDGNPVNWGYQSCNNGTAPLYDCTLVDANTDVSAPIIVGNLAPNSCGAPNVKVATHNPLACSTALESAEAANGKVTLTCCTTDVAGIADCAEASRVSVFDESNVTCQTQSGLDIVKTCVDGDQNGTDDSVTVQVSAGAGDLGFTNCTPTDTMYLDDPTCPPVGSGTAVALATPAGPYDLAPGTSETSEGTLSVLTANACNTASVTCTNGSGEPVTEDAAPVICHVQPEGCITRTPGFWGNRPITTVNYLPIEVCGKSINSVLANTLSTSETMCSVGKDGKILGDQVTQLIRQCTAAALNLNLSKAEGGGCPDADNANFTDCCGAANDGTGPNLCSAQNSGSSKGVSECIGLLDEFNNRYDSMPAKAFAKLGAAQPTQCKASKNNGYHPYAF